MSHFQARDVFYLRSQAGSLDTFDDAIKFVLLTPNGEVFVAGLSQLTEYGLLTKTW